MYRLLSIILQNNHLCLDFKDLTLYLKILKNIDIISMVVPGAVQSLLWGFMYISTKSIKSLIKSAAVER